MKTPFEQVCVICVTYQSAKLVAQLKKQYAIFPNVVVVDNASTDHTVALLASEIPHAQFLVNDQNLGFGAANNRGLSKVNQPYTLLLNPDCEITAQSVQRLMQTLEEFPSLGMVSPQIFHPDGRPQLSGKNAFFQKTKTRGIFIADALCSVRWLSGACMLVRSDVMRQIGGFDAGFFLYYEDDDLCLRMHNAGYTCALEPAATAIHIGGGASPMNWRLEIFKNLHYALSHRRLLAKYQGPQIAYRYQLKTLLASLIAVPAFLLTLRKKNLLKWIGRGAASFYSLKPYVRIKIDA